MNDGKRRLGFLERIYAADDGGANGAFRQSLMHLPALDKWQVLYSAEYIRRSDWASQPLGNVGRGAHTRPCTRVPIRRQ